MYAGGKIDWADVVIPDGLDVVDMRLELHGFKLVDGNVIEGTVTDIITGKPLAATMQLEDNGHNYKVVRTVKCNDEGHWVVTSAPKGWHRIALSADGYARCVVCSVNFTYLRRQFSIAPDVQSEIAKLIRQLGDSSFVQREAASAKLGSFGVTSRRQLEASNSFGQANCLDY